jgi:methionyl-tRNA formyltransferase
MAAAEPGPETAATAPQAHIAPQAAGAPLAPIPVRPQRLAYLGTPAMAVPPLQALVASGWDVALVVTGADTRRGRGGATSPTPVKAAAVELGLPVAHRVEDVLDAGADLGVVVAYGRLIRGPVLERLGFVNLHFSLLPRWRGAAPVERALLAGDPETGVCLMQLEEGLDTGPVFAHRRVPIDSRVTAGALRRQLVEVGSELLCTTLDTGLHDPTPQQGEVTYAAKLTPADLEIDWGAAADVIDRVVRVGGAWTTWRGRRLKVLDAEPVDAVDADEADEADGPAPGTLAGDEVATGSGRLRLLTVQPEGKPAMPAAAWRHGAHPGPGDRLGA